MIGLGRQEGGLYHLVAPTSETPRIPPSIKKLACLSVSIYADTWHQRLRYLSCSHLQVLFKILPRLRCPLNKVCEVCPPAKQTRLPFGTSSIFTIKPFDLIHVDI